MTFISKKTIHGKIRYYLEKSVRSPSGEVKKYSIYLKDYDPKKGASKEDKQRLQEKVEEGILSWAASYYKKNSIFDEVTLRKLEAMRLGYKKITKNLTKNQWQDLIDRFTANFTYESNAIEGNSLTLKDVTMVLHEKIAIKGADLRDIYETLNTREAMNLLFTKKIKIKEKDIIKLHKVLVKDTGVTIGYKTLPNFLLGRNVKTAPPEKTEKEMEKLIGWYHENKEMHPLQRAAIFHGRFEKTHPFEDGNGRVGRILINAMLIDAGYPPLIIQKTHRVAYFSSLSACDNGYDTKLERFLIEKYKKTYQKFFEVYVKYLPQDR